MLSLTYLMVTCGMTVQRKKEIESKVFDLRVRLEDEGANEAEIVRKEKELRARLSDASTSIITRGRGYVHLILPILNLGVVGRKRGCKLAENR